MLQDYERILTADFSIALSQSTICRHLNDTLGLTLQSGRTRLNKNKALRIRTSTKASLCSVGCRGLVHHSSMLELLLLFYTAGRAVPAPVGQPSPSYIHLANSELKISLIHL
jgi:hypothetical protein